MGKYVIFSRTALATKLVAVFIFLALVIPPVPAVGEILGVEEEAALEEEEPAPEEVLTPSPDHPGLFTNPAGELVDDLGIIIRLAENESLCIKCHYGKSEHEKLVLGWDKSKHAMRGMSCAKCHGGNSAASVLADAKKESTGFKHIKDALSTLTGERAIQAAFEYCGSCHGEKYREWSAGIHGKRLGYWNGEKQMWVCVKCHNPHNPKIRKIKPKPAPVKPSEIGVKSQNVAKGK
ncbi:MAG: cytochrome c3 family protein [Nitrospinae bacterium]|nr:cytochrome c3 family protein [Nitrospinota bacterium]